MRKIKKLNGVVAEYNGIVARLKKDPSEDNRKLLDETLNRLHIEVNEVLSD